MTKSMENDSLTGFLLRSMELEDVPEVHRIETLCFSAPWSLDAFYSELDNKLALYHVAELEGRIIGYCGIWVVIDEGHITNLAIDPAEQGHHYGLNMMKAVIMWAKNIGICRLTLEVRVSNEKAIRMYEQLGFVSAGLRKGYYEDTGEDASIMWLELND